MAEFKGKVAIITGSSSGIGAATAEHFASLGCKMTIAARRLNQLQEVKQKCVAKGVNADDILIVVADVGKMDELDKIIDGTIAKFGQLNYLINNAATIVWKGIRLLNGEEYDRMMNVNTKSAQFLSKKALPHLTKTKGCIVNMSSDSGIRPTAICTTYCMSKAAMNMLTKCTAADFAINGVRVNAICPGYIDTPIYSGSAMEDVPNMADVLPPIGRIGQPIDIARMVQTLCSEETAGFMTGAIIMVDGGDQVSTILPPAIQDIEKRMCGHPPYDK